MDNKMDLESLNSGTPTLKLYLNPVVNTLTANVVTASEFIGPIESSSLTIDEVKGVPNPPVGKITLFSDMAGILNGTNSLGDTTTYISTPAPSTSTVGNFPKYLDSSGTSIGDSGFGVTDLKEVITEISSVPSSIQPLAPSGLRDLWKIPSGLTFNGGFLNYDSKNDVLYSSDWNIPGTTPQYSTDGGISWSGINFNISPSNSFIIGISPGLWVAVPSYQTGNFYTSTDGINFTQGPAQANTLVSYNIIYNSVSSLFIAGINSDATHWVSTSPDGVTWTPRVTPDFTGLLNFTNIAQSDDGKVVVIVGDSLVQPVYSLDGGITWASGVGSTSACQAITYNSSVGYFFGIGAADGVSCISYDGINYTSLGAISPSGTISVIWNPVYDRLYLAHPLQNSGTSNYSIWTSMNPHLPFITTTLDGSSIIGVDYNTMVYLPTYDRFVLSVDGVGVAYSTSRPNTIKSTGDSILVRGNPVTYQSYSQFTQTGVDSSTVETSLPTAPDSIGSLTMPITSYQQAGGSIVMKMIFTEQGNGTDRVTIKLKLNTVTIVSQTITSTSSLQSGVIDFIMNIGGNYLNVMMKTDLNADSPDISTNRVMGYDSTVTNTFDVTAQWTDTSGSFSCLQFTITLGGI